MSSSPRTLPDLNGANAPHWRGARGGRLMVQVCQACRKPRYPYAARCPVCESADSAWESIRGSGRVRSWCRFHRMYFPEFKDAVPYTVLLVRMDDGVDLFGNFESGAIHDTPCIGEPVYAVFEPVGDEAALVRFRRGLQAAAGDAP